MQWKVSLPLVPSRNPAISPSTSLLVFVVFSRLPRILLSRLPSPLHSSQAFPPSKPLWLSNSVMWSAFVEESKWHQRELTSKKERKERENGAKINWRNNAWNFPRFAEEQSYMNRILNVAELVQRKSHLDTFYSKFWSAEIKRKSMWKATRENHTFHIRKQWYKMVRIIVPIAIMGVEVSGKTSLKR